MTTHSGYLGRLCVVALVGLLVVGAAVPASAHSGEDSSFVVALHEDGSAELTLTLTYDLADEDDRAAFEALQDDASARERVRTRFRDRLAAVAADAENATGREMAVTDASVALSTTHDGATGVVELSATYEGLAAVENGRLTVTEPFASGFETDHRFTLRAPDGYRLASVGPEPASQEDGRVTWSGGNDLSGFEATLTAQSGATATDGSDEAVAGTTGDASSGAGAGFGLLAALLAVGIAGLLARRRNR